MSRVMAVRNDEELKNLKKIGIVGVRYQPGHPRLEANESYAYTVVEPIAVVRNSM